MLNDNVGKKIVEVLKMQKEREAETQSTENIYTSGIENSFKEDTAAIEQETINQDLYNSDINTSQSTIDNAFAQSIAQNLGNSSFVEPMPNIDFPSNVSILNNLISKLPVGVSKQTGALIIKQTMEALGIPMTSVLQEARQVQDSLSANALECQKNIIEYKKQIGLLEQKAQTLQKQAVAMNDIISLFAKTNA